MKLINELWLGLGVLVILSPLGLILPEYFKAGSAWGEWGVDEIQKLAGYIPKGLDKFSHFWSAPLPNYAFREGEGESILVLGLSYILSAVIGVLICIGVVFILGKLLSKKE